MFLQIRSKLLIKQFNHKKSQTAGAKTKCFYIYWDKKVNEEMEM